jgi:hypothetical protein
VFSAEYKALKILCASKDSMASKTDRIIAGFARWEKHPALQTKDGNIILMTK